MSEGNETRAPANADTVDANTALTEAAESEGDNLPFELPAPGYQLGTMIGKGGMGEVIAAHDQRIGRDVAFKRMRNANVGGEALARFLREARIQARLDHPAIVPVYELGKDAEGRPYFTMKRLTGKTLTAHLADKDASRQRLLRAFADVCLAIELAHSKGVIHRDLKPSNIMLGDFGEVYVLDWGIARVLTDKKRAPTGGMQADDIDSIPGEHTLTGDMLGTLGYMAPEQMRGELDRVGPAVDVYALGSILFELLAGEPLHPRGHAAVASTLSMEGASPAERKPERNIPPELDAACSSALVADPTKRPSARELAEKINSYLDGDRDVERRRALAAENLTKARELFAAGDDKRADAMRAAGRAMALDPAATEAAELVSRMMVEPPAKRPAEIVEMVNENENRQAKLRARKGITAVVSLLSLSVCTLFLEVRDWTWLIAIWAVLISSIGMMWVTYKTGRIFGGAILFSAIVLAVLFSRVASPLVLLPTLLCGSILPFSNIPQINDRPWLLYAWCLVAALLPSVLEMSGVLAPTLTMGNSEHFFLRSAIFGHSREVGLYWLVVSNAVLLVAVARFAIAIGRERRNVQDKLTNQAWHLRKLLP